jgi:putative redox protein
VVTSQTQTPGAFRQVLTFARDGQQLFSDSATDGGGGESAPGPHDLFDASLAACKALTAHWYARQRGFPLERVTATLERDASREREGHYGLTVTLEFHGPLTAEQKARLLDVTARCPVHKLMTQVEISITTLAAQP